MARTISKRLNPIAFVDKFSLHVLIVLCAAVLPYLNAGKCGFVFDDSTAVVNNADVKGTSPWIDILKNDFWGTPVLQERSHKSYRPLTILSFRLTNLLFGGIKSVVFHLENILYHAITSVLLLLFARNLMTESGALLSSVIFAVHPVHVEAVTGIVGRAELLCAIFSLIVLLIYFNVKKSAHRPFFKETGLVLLLLPITAAAMFSKEQGVTIIAVCAVFEIFEIPIWNVAGIKALITLNTKRIHHKVWRALWRVVLVALIVAVLLFVRLMIQQGQLPHFTVFDNPAAGAPYPDKQLTFAYLVLENIKLLLMPFYLLCDWSMGTIPLVTSLTDPRCILMMLFFNGMPIVLFFAFMRSEWKNRAFILLTVLLIVLPFLPASNLLFPVGFVVAERILYVPSIGWCLLIGRGMSSLISKFAKSSDASATSSDLVGAKTVVKPPSENTDTSAQRRRQNNLRRNIALAVVAVYVFSLGLRTFLRNEEWIAERTLFLSALRVTHRNAKCWNNVGHTYESLGEHTMALRYFRLATKVQPDDTGALINVGRAFQNMGLNDRAEAAFRSATNYFPKAEGNTAITTRVAPRDLEVHLLLGRLIKNNATRRSEAEQLYRRVMAMRPDWIDAYVYLGELQIEEEKYDEAAASFKSAIQLAPRRADLYHNLAVAYLKKGEKELSLRVFDKALELDPNHFQSLGNAGMMLADSPDADTKRLGVVYLSRAFALHQDARYAFNAGVAEGNLKNTTEAIKWFGRAVAVAPQYTLAWLNLAQLYKDNRQIKLAEDAITTVLRMEPDNVRALSLKADITINEHKRPSEARKLYKRLLKLEPGKLEAHHNLCACDMQEGKLAEAYRCYSTVINSVDKKTMQSYIDQVKGILQTIEQRLAAAGGTCQDTC